MLMNKKNKNWNARSKLRLQDLKRKNKNYLKNRDNKKMKEFLNMKNSKRLKKDAKMELKLVLSI